MKWIACELHTHTFHSDGRQSLLELARGAADLGFDCIALTDHNTMSGLAEREAAESATGITIIPGMEWTTFYGHMVTVGLQQFVDWRQADIRGIGSGAAEVRKHSGAAGMAHPFRIGSPICTGCYWEFEVENWQDLDYIEVWSGTFAPVKADNRRAFAFWTDRLNEGVRIAATSGRDWHEQVATEEPISVTYLGLEDETAPIDREAVRSLKAGRAVVTIGPLVTLEARSDGIAYGIGEAIPAARSGRLHVRVAVDSTVRAGKWEPPAGKCKLVLMGNTGTVAEQTLERLNGSVDAFSFTVPDRDLRWLRAELWGEIRGVRTMIAFTNAIYLD
jgi:Predicted metal-dependent phosphoesterases (PHP family)